MASTYRCPGCDAILKLANPLSPGKKIGCPKCQIIFAPEEEEIPVRGAAIQARSRVPLEEGHRARAPLEEVDPPPRRSRRAERDEDEDFDRDRYEDEDEDFVPRRRSQRRRSRGSNKGLLIGLLAGGGALLLIGLGVLLFLLLRQSGTSNALVGRWQSTLMADVTLEFRADGTLIQNIPFPGKGVIPVHQKYRIINATTLELETGPEAFNFGKPGPGGNFRETVTYSITGDELVISDVFGRKTFRRIR
jgi:hypothetical protein